MNPYSFTPAMLDFEESLVAGEPIAPRTVRGWCDVRLDAVQAETSRSLGTAMATVDPERPHEFAVIYTPGDRQPGDLQGVITLRGVAEDGRRLVPGGIRVVARVLHPVRVEPVRVSFGRIAPGEVPTADLSLSSRLNSTFHVGQIIAPPGIELEPLGDSAWRLRVNEPQTGYVRETVRLEIRNASNSRPYWLEVPVSYRLDPTALEVTVAEAQP